MFLELIYLLSDSFIFMIYSHGVDLTYFSDFISGVFDSSSMMLTVYADRPDIAEGQKIDVLRYKSK